MILSIVVATAENNVIGKDNQLIWHMPADLKFFKDNTMGCPVIMGRKTFQSIGRALPGRKNIVVTRDRHFNDDKKFGITVAGSVEEALAAVEQEPKVCIVGGSEIYRQSMHLVNEIYRTVIHHNFDGDTFFPKIDATQFRLVWEEPHTADEKNKYDYTFQKFERT
jgi:dihydrofolate reductase